MRSDALSELLCISATCTLKQYVSSFIGAQLTRINNGKRIRS